jgi:hypothetical protein
MFVKVVRNIVMMWSCQLFHSENGDQILSPFFWKYTSERHKNNVFSDVYIKSHFVDGKSSSLCNWARAHRKELKTCDAQRITIILIHTPSSSWGWRRKSESVTWSSDRMWATKSVIVRIFSRTQKMSNPMCVIVQLM